MENNEIPSSKLSSITANTEPLSNEHQFCWICFCTDTEDSSTEWVRPCKCSGSVQWVHQKCLQRWIEKKQKGNSRYTVKCPHCLVKYIIIKPRMGMIIGVLHEINMVVKRSCPFLAAGIVYLMFHWTLVAYGSLTVLQIMGYREGMHLLENTRPLVLVMVLPIIPISSFMCQLIRLDDMIIRYLRNEPFLPFSNNDQNSEDQRNRYSSRVSLTRVICTAIFFPTFSSIIGNAFFKSIENNIVRAVFGGFSFFAITGTLNIILQQNELVRKKNQKVLDYNEQNVQEYSNDRLDGLSSGSMSDVSGVSSAGSMELMIIESVPLL